MTNAFALAFFTAMLLTGCSQDDAASCPLEATTCPSGCSAVTLREVDTASKCQRIPAARPCANAAPRPEVTVCCAKASTGALYQVVGFPSCDLEGFRPCTADEKQLADAAQSGC